MALLNDATALYVGSQPVIAVYQGGVKVWPPAAEDEEQEQS